MDFDKILHIAVAMKFPGKILMNNFLTFSKENLTCYNNIYLAKIKKAKFCCTVQNLASFVDKFGKMRKQILPTMV
jgi:hypothetical protein